MNDVSLKEISIHITDGEHGTVKDDPNGEYYFLSNKNIVDNEIKYNNNDRRINKTVFDKINKRTKLEKNDLLLSTVGTIGKTVIIKDDPNYTFQRSVGIIKINKELANPYYIKYYLDNPIIQKKLNKIANGGVQKGIYISDLEDLRIQLPDIQIQDNKALLLKTIDEKIDINNKINLKLKELISLIYRYYFVQFSFPENYKSHKKNNIELRWNEELKTNIPSNWEVKPLSEVEKNIITGKTPSTKNKNYFNGNIPFITIDDIRKGDYIFNTERTLTKEGADSQKNKYIPKNSICVSCIATVGEIGLTTKDSQTNQQINSIVCENSYNRYYLLNYLENYFSLNNSAKSGNIFDNMNKEDFSNIKIIYPTKDVLVLFEEKVDKYYNMIKNNIEENLYLSEYRDYILPLLMNGQIKIED